MLTVQRYDAATISSYERTPQGGIRARARLTRSGVLDYELPDGTVRREWRPPEEVFALDSYRTLWDVPVTVHHPDEGEVDSGTYRRETVGHVCSDVKPEGEYLAGSVVIQDSGTVSMVLNGSLKEFSPGYLAALDPTPGVVPAGMPDAGKPYDVIQRRIRYNHEALLPPGQGRSGPEVAIRLDSRGNQIGPLTPKEHPMELTPEQLQKLSALAAVSDKLVALAAAPTPAAPPPAPAPAPTNDAPPAAPPAAPTAPEKKEDQVPNPEEKKNDAKAKAEADAETERRVNDSIELREQARTVLGADTVFTGKSNKDIMVDVVKHVDSKFELGNRDETYLRARFDGALVQHRELQSLQQHSALRGSLRNDSTEADPSKPVVHVDSLQAKISNAWQTPKK
jgi:hypothetical protein